MVIAKTLRRRNKKIDEKAKENLDELFEGFGRYIRGDKIYEIQGQILEVMEGQLNAGSKLWQKTEKLQEDIDLIKEALSRILECQQTIISNGDLIKRLRGEDENKDD